MMFRETKGPRGSWVRCIRTVYDKETKRGRQVLLGKFSPYDKHIPEEVLADLTEAERGEAKAWLAARHAKDEQSQVSFEGRYIVSRLRTLKAMLDDPSKRDQAVEAMVGAGFPDVFDEFSKAVRKVKALRPSKEKIVQDAQPGPLLTAMESADPLDGQVMFE
jgi:hypothetical protein